MGDELLGFGFQVSSKGISVSSVASCEEVANLTLASQHFSPQAWEVLPRDSVFSFMVRTSSS